MKKPLKILLVDDEKVILSVLARELRLKNYTVSIAAGGEEALTLLKSACFDAVITDLDMPDIDGISVLKVSKQQAPQTCVLILTGYGDMNSAIDALRLGADDYLIKPCDIDELCIAWIGAWKKNICSPNSNSGIHCSEKKSGNVNSTNRN